MKKMFKNFLVSLLVLGSAAGALGEGLTPLDVAKLKMVGGADISPNGRYIAYTMAIPQDPSAADFKNDGALAQLRVYDTKTGLDRLFVGHDDKMRSIRWSPDSRAITFLSKRGDDKHTSLYQLPVDGGEAELILSFEESISSYSLSPDGRRVAFTAVPALDKAKKDLREKGFNQEIFEEEWRNSQVYVAQLQASTKDLKPLAVEGHISSVEWSPKQGDNRLLLVKAQDPSVDASLMYQRATVVDLSGKLLTAIENPGKLGQLEWSPDAKHISLVAGVDIHDPDTAELFLADAVTGKMKSITPGVQAKIDHFAWKDGGSLVAAVSQGSDSKMMTIGLDGKLSPVASNPDLNYLMVDAAGGSVVTVADSAKHPRELFLNNKRLTDSNPWLKGKELAPQKLVTYKTRDGLEIEGILIPPLKASGPAPTLLVVHGGPESHYDDGWLTNYSSPGQVGAAEGYAVFYPNYRGSTGRGVAFSKLSQGDPAGKEFDDLIDAVDYLVAQGIADKNRVGVTGGSYGGYATAWLSTRYTERFAAGVMFVGISDKVSKVGTTDIPDEEFLVHARKRPWDAFDFFAERSPIRYVKQAKTPLLIMHGKEDPRVHPTQSMELYRFLKVLNQTPVRLVLYPGEGHGNRKAAARYDYNLRMMRWFDTFLKGDGKEKPPVDVDYKL